MSDSPESDEDAQPQGPYSQPYAYSYGFAATSWQLRKNLTETFNQHAMEKKPSKARHYQDANRSRAAQPATVLDKVAHYEQKSLKPAALGKPPRQPQQPSQQSEDAKTWVSERRGVSVYLRVRPPKTGMVNTIEILPGNPPTKVRTHAPAKSNAAKINRERNANDPPTFVREFDFQEIFGPEKRNQDVYSKTCAPMVQRMFPPHSVDSEVSKEPESGLLFAYGATNAGKSYSILGKVPSKKRDGTTPMDQKHMGIVPRAMTDILDHLQPDQSLYLSYFEIYNENIYDLLEDTKNQRNPMYMREPLKLRETQNKNIIVRGLQKRRIHNVEEGLELARQANSKRQTSSNNLNSDSSRSHCICQLEVVKRAPDVAPMRGGSLASSGYNTEEEAVQISKRKPISLWICDLAGSERSKKTNAGSIRQKEASLINKSLMNLMRCLSIIRENQSTACTSQIIPFRENKLTHLFMPVFTGRKAASISMIVNVNPAAPDFDETNHVLSYASQAKLVQIEDQHMEEKDSRHATGEYGYNGRPLKKSSVTSKFSRLVKKLSPKKLMQRGNSKDEKRRTTEQNAERKRKPHPPVARVPSFSSTVSNASQNGPKAKKMKVVKPSTSFNTQPKASSSLKRDQDEIQTLKMALSVAQAEVEALKSEKAQMEANLSDEIAQVEAKIRLEVSDEMEHQLESTKRHYTNIIDTMKAQSRQSLGIFEKRAREEKAAEQIDVLFFKVEECEAEMQRQAEAHQMELVNLGQAHQQEVIAFREEIERLKKVSNSSGAAGGGNDEVVKAQQLRILEQERELEALKKSKTDMIAAYEQLLAGEEETEDDENVEDEEGSITSPEEEQVRPRYMTRTRSTQKEGRKINANRSPLSSISGNRV